MARQPSHIPLNVFLNGRLVGRLKKESSGAIEFLYDKDWLASEHNLPISVSLPLREDRYIGNAVTVVFDNLLPDNEMIRRHLAERVGAGGSDAYSLLAAVGRDCVGALQFLPDNISPGPTGVVNGQPLTDTEIVSVLNNLSRAPLGVTENDDFRISLAGMQEKTALLLWKGVWNRPIGSTATTHILKPQIGVLSNRIDLSQSVENEHFCMSFLSALGLPTARTEIHDFVDKRVLVVGRFDRSWSEGNNKLLRLPQEDCCQALSIPSSKKYESEGGPGIKQILEFLNGSDIPEHDQKLFLQTQVAFWLLGATDGHAKNFSITLGIGGRFHLTPLYDVMSAQPNVDAKQITKNKMKMAMAVGSNRHYVVDSIVPRHFIQSAELAGLPAKTTSNWIDEVMEKTPTALATTLSGLKNDFPSQISASIHEGIERRLKQVRAHDTNE
jgi:serine/threonine-protein kinase HipA